jgi:hypothetical protein
MRKKDKTKTSIPNLAFIISKYKSESLNPSPVIFSILQKEKSMPKRLYTIVPVIIPKIKA